MERGKFIVFEGLDGCGKTTQLFNLKKKLNDYGVKCVGEREPSDGIVGLLTRGAVKKKIEFRPETMALLFAADRFEHVTNDILPQLEAGVTVLCDRFVFSNLAFQSLSIPMSKIHEYNQLTLDILMPDLTIFIDVPSEICSRRIKQERVHMELYEDEEKLRAVRECFFQSFAMYEAAHVKIIEGNKNEGIVFDKIWEAVKVLMDL